MKYSFDDLVKIMATLRSENGCPWDRKQTHQSLLPYLVEESHEFIDAAQANDKVHMAEELGDVLFQVVFHAQVAKDNKDFSIDDVVQGICEKMVRRHPHVFGDVKVENENEFLDVNNPNGLRSRWESIKAAEKNNLGMAGKSAMDKVSKSMPTLARAQEIQRRAAKVGFDWIEAEPVFNKAVEEFSEFRAEMQAASAENPNVERMEDEFGDILFSLVNVARHCGFNAALALERANSKFEKRFRIVEDLARAEGKQMQEETPERLQELWREAKARTKLAT